jgi:uncharacterized membrane protein YccC
MTEAAPPSASADRPPPAGARAWVRSKDPEFLAVKRSVRAAVVMPLAFGLAHLLFSNPQVGLFAAFGSFSLLLLVEFQGRPRSRLTSYVIVFVIGVVLISLGTVASTHKIAAVATMAVIGFAVLFAGIASPTMATASTAVLLVFVLPVAVAAPNSAVGPRLVGWAIAGILAVPACMLIWPPPWHDDLRRRLSATALAVSQLAKARADGRADPEAQVEAQTKVQSELLLLRQRFRGTPYPATGAVASAVALAKLVGRIEWVAGNEMLTAPDTASAVWPAVRAVIRAVAETLRLSASLICDGAGHPVDDPTAIDAVQESIQQLDQLVATEVSTAVSVLIDPHTNGDRADDLRVTATGGHDDDGTAPVLDPTFHARALGIAAEMVADAALEAAGARPPVDRRLGPDEPNVGRPVLSRILSHLSFRSVWFRNAVRGAAGLAIAVAVVEITDVEHGFWVVLGTLSVLRSNAVGTGATALRAIGGTAVGVVLGSAVMVGVANHTILLWVLLPLAVLLSGVVPSMVSFAAGQAGFTLVVVILFNIIDPLGWKVGLTRIEDVAIGCAVSIVVGLLFWPRGATAALGHALSDAFVTSSGYLSDAVERLTTTSYDVDTGPGLRASHRAYLRLDDAFRQYLAERGAKVVPVETVSNLFTGSNRIRLAANALSSLPVDLPSPGLQELESVATAGAVLRDSYASSHRWYEEFGDMLAARRQSLDPPPDHDDTLRDVLQQAFDDARVRQRGDRVRATLQMLWADELLESQRRVQADLAGSADLLVRQKHRSLMI